MKKIQFYSFVIALICCVSCSTSNVPLNPDDLEVKKSFEITQYFHTETPVIDEWLDSIKIVPLETNEEALLSKASNIDVTDEYIYVSDNSEVLIFKQNGDFVKRIPKGQGPGEITYLSAFRLNHFDNYLYIIDYKKLNKYTSDGSFIESHEIDVFNNFLPVDNGYLAYKADLPNNAKYSFFATDTAFNVISSKVINKKKFLLNGQNQMTYCSNAKDTIIFNTPYDNYIYQFPCNNPDDITIRYKFVFENEFDASQCTNPDGIGKLFGMMKTGDCSLDGTTFENKNYITCTNIYKHPKIDYDIFINKKNGEIRNQWSSHLLMQSSNIIGVYNDYFYLTISPFQIVQAKELIIEHNKKYLSDKDVETIRNLNENDNPIIVFFKLK